MEQNRPLYFCPVVSIFLSSFFLLYFPRLISVVGDWMATILLEVYHTSTHDVALLSANLECMSEMCCTRLAENTGRKNTQNLFNGNISSICLHNMLNFGPLMAEICWRVWGIPANFKGFRVLASLLHCTDVAQWRSTKLCTMFGRLLRWWVSCS